VASTEILFKVNPSFEIHSRLHQLFTVVYHTTKYC